MKKIYFLFAMALTAFVASAQTPVTIVNGDFSLPDDNNVKYTTLSGNAIPGWNSDDATTDHNGRENNKAYMWNIGGSIYNVLGEVIPSTGTTYSLTFTDASVWNSASGTELDFIITFSSLASGAVATTRSLIQTVNIKQGIDADVANVTIPAGAAFAGANLVIEIAMSQVGATNTWWTFDNFALTKTDAPSGVKNVESTSFRAYPNPFKDNLNVESEEVIKNVSIYSVNGQRIKDLTINSTKADIETSNLSKGAYMLKVETANGTKTMNVVK